MFKRAEEQGDLSNRSSIFKMTGGGYYYGFSFHYITVMVMLMFDTTSSDSPYCITVFLFNFVDFLEKQALRENERRRCSCTKAKSRSSIQLPRSKGNCQGAKATAIAFVELV